MQCDEHFSIYRCIRYEGHEGLHHSYGLSDERQIVFWGTFRRGRESEVDLNVLL
jgi:hypothetical protein